MELADTLSRAQLSECTQEMEGLVNLHDQVCANQMRSMLRSVRPPWKNWILSYS